MQKIWVYHHHQRRSIRACHKHPIKLNFASSLTTLFYTGSSAFLLPPKPIRSIAMPIYGPTTGTFLANAAIVPRKSPKRTMIPYSSTRKPINGQRSKIRASPPKKAAVPFIFCLRAKNRRVLAGPMITVRPMRKRICHCGRWISMLIRGLI